MILSARSNTSSTIYATAVPRRFFGRVERTAYTTARVYANRFFSSVTKVPMATIAIHARSTSNSTGPSRSANASVLLLLFFGFINVFPIFPMFIMFLAFFQIARCFINFVCLLGLVFNSEVVQVRIEVMFTNRLARDLLSVVLNNAFIRSRCFMVICMDRVVCLLGFVYFGEGGVRTG